MISTIPQDTMTEDFADRAEWSGDRRRGLPAWLLSVVLHATLFVALGLLAPAPGTQPPGEPERVVGIALVERTSGSGPQYFSEGDSAATSSSPAAAVATNAAPTVAGLEKLQVDSGIRLPTAAEGVAGVSGAIGLPSATGLTTGGTGRGQGVFGGQTRTQVFGAKGQGSEFVYVFDRSSSMSGFGGRPLAAAKAELQRSLNDLVSGNRFQIVFYNERPAVLNPFRSSAPTMFFATEENKLLARDYVQQIAPAGGTAHMDALKLALRMGPDVIFFLTDAADPQLTASELAEVRRRNQAASIINAIEFGAGPFPGGENFLVRLARQNRGQHVYVDVTALPEGM